MFLPPDLTGFASFSGFIDRNELQLLADELGETLDDAELEAAMKEIDVSGDGKISFEVRDIGGLCDGMIFLQLSLFHHSVCVIALLLHRISCLW